MTFIGESNWTSVGINVSVRVSRSALDDSSTPSVSLSVLWSRMGGQIQLSIQPLNGTWNLGCANLHGTLPAVSSSGWQRVSFGALSDGTLFGSVDDVQLFCSAQCASHTDRGFAALGTGTHRADFDDLILWLPPPVPPPPPLPNLAPGAWIDASLARSLQSGTARNDFSGLAGVSFRVVRAVSVNALGRIVTKKAGDGPKSACALGGRSLQKHNLSLWQFASPLPYPGGESATLMASTIVDLATGRPDGAGFMYATIAPVALVQGDHVSYALTSEEHENGDIFCDGALLPAPTINESVALLTGGIWAYRHNGSVLHPSARPSSGTFDGRVYGPVSFTILQE